jgi:hypothetical protein
MTVFPLPARPINDLTIQERRAAFEATYSGQLRDAMDLYRTTVGEDGWQSGLLQTMSGGILGLPSTFQGNPEMVSALLDADGTPGDYNRTHPGSECAKIFEDGIATNFGLGQQVLMCWECGFTNISEDQCCQTCGVWQQRRPIGLRKLFQLQWRDPRWLWQNTLTRQLYYTGNGGFAPVNKGDGEWFLFQPYPEVDAWRHGAWLYMTLAAIFARDAVYDRQRVSEVTTPVQIAKAVKPTTPQARLEFHQQLQESEFDKRMTLPEEWDFKIECATKDYSEVAEQIVTWATSMVEVGLTGNLMGMKAQSAFTDAGIYRRTTTERRRFYSLAWIRADQDQNLSWWGRDNYGTRNVPIQKIDVESPEDKLAALKALEQHGTSLNSAREAYNSLGYDLDPSWILENAQRAGIRIIKRATL